MFVNTFIFLSALLSTCKNMEKVPFRRCKAFRSSVLEIIASVKINNKSMSLMMSGRNPCFGNLIPRCPVVKGDMYIFSGSFDIYPAYPVGAMNVKYGLRDIRLRKQLLCAIIPTIIGGGVVRNKI